MGDEEPKVGLQRPDRMPVELVVHESMIRLGKDLQSGGVELRFDTPLGLSVKVPFTREGWAKFIGSGTQLVSGVMPVQRMPGG